MSRAFGRALAAALIAGLLGAAWTALFYAWRPALRIEFDRDLPRAVGGIYPPERDDATGLTFAWTGADAVLRLPGLDRAKRWTLDLRVRGARVNDNPSLVVVADGAVVTTIATTTDWSDIHVALPERPGRRGLVLGLKPSTTFVPGPGDARSLGVMIDSLSLSPQGVVLVPRATLTAATIASAVMGAALAVLGVTAGSAIGGAVLLGAGIASIVTRGFAPFTDYPDRVVPLGIWIAVALAALALICEAARRQSLRNTARFAAAFSAAALLLKLLVLLHPNMPIGDAMFHAHRFQGVLGGNLYFTSVAPGGYNFPYPPGLYVFAKIFAGMVRRGASDVALLRIITCAVDALAGLLLYWVVAGVWRNRLAAAMAVAIYQIVPMDFSVLTTGNLTNAFAQSVAVIALVVMGSGHVVFRRPAAIALLSALLAAAYLSHTSTIAIVFTATMLIALFFVMRRDRSFRATGGAIALASIAAAALAVAIYYAHFTDTYRTEFARIGHETAITAADAGGRTIGQRAAYVPYALAMLFGWPVLSLAVAGAALRWRDASDSLSIALCGWTSACLLFLVIGVLTPVDMRYYLAAIPLIAIGAAFAAAWPWTHATRTRRAALQGAVIALLLLTVSHGVQHWWSILG